MRVLGLNGWGARTHDASACLLVDGEIVAYAEEERFSRRKHGFDARPEESATYCLAEAGLGLDDLDAVAFGWNMPWLYAARSCDDATIRAGLDHLLPTERFPRRTNPPLEYVDHHVAHAASAYLLCGEPSAAVLVIDGQGEDASASLYHGVNGQLRLLHSYPVGWSLGYLYEAACTYVGMRTTDAGKLMGLAAYGRPLDVLDRYLDYTPGGYELPGVKESYIRGGYPDEQQPVLDAWLPRFVEAFGRPVNRVDRVTDPRTGASRAVPAVDCFEYRDAAATVQAVLEEAISRMAAGLLAATGERVLVLAGGVAYNATLNGKLRRLPGLDRMFVQPVAGDAGVALGAAARVAADGGDAVRPLDTSIAFGPSYRPDEIRRTLDAAGLRYTEPVDLADDVAGRIRAGHLVGWFQGRAEVGPRALGSRSLLALPHPVRVRDRVNLEAKRRERWRPLAPSVTEEAAPALFGTDLRLPFMIVTTEVTPEVRGELGAVTHEDGTTRPQTVSAASHPLYHRVVAQAGVHGALLNTSFNGRDEPIVGSPADAVRTFADLKLDTLAIGPFVVDRPS